MPRVVLAILCALLGLACGNAARGQTGPYGSPPPYDASAYVQPSHSNPPQNVPRPWSGARSAGTAGAHAAPLPRAELQPTTATTTAGPTGHTAHLPAGLSNTGRELPPASHQREQTSPRAEVAPAVAAETTLPEPPARTVVQPASYRAAARTERNDDQTPSSAAIPSRSLAPANSDQPQRREGVPPPLDPARSLTTIGSGLAVVIGLFLLAAWWWRKRMPQSILPLPGGVLEVLGRSSLDTKHRLHLVRLGNKLLLISTTADCAETLAEIDDPDEVTRLIGLCLQSRPGSSSRAFRDVLTELAHEGGSGRRESRTSGVPDELASLQAALRRAREANLG